MLRRARAPAVARIALALALGGLSRVAGAAPDRCEASLTASPSPLPRGLPRASVRIPGIHPDVQLRASSGTTGLPAAAGIDSMVAELTIDPGSPPLVLVAAIGGTFCGFGVVRVPPSPDAVPAPGPVTLVTFDPPAAPGDRESTEVVYVFAVDEHGAPRTGGAPTLQPEAGSVGAVEAVGPGAWRATWRVPASKAEASRVGVVFGSGPPGRGSLTRTAGRPAAVEIAEDPASNVNGVPGAVIVRIRDSAGNLTDGTPTLESDRATVGPPVRLERGVYRAPLKVPDGTRGSLYVTATANRNFASTVLTIAPPSSPASQVTIEPHEPIRADGSSPGQLLIFPVSVLDASGNPASEAPLGNAELGKFLDPLFVAPGAWMLPYRPPRVLEDSTDHLSVRAGNATTRLDLRLLASRFSVSVGVKGGMTVASRFGPALGLEGMAWWFVGRTQLGVALDASWWTLSQSSAATVGGGTASYDARQHYLPVLVSLSWRMPFASRWLLWASAGGGVSWVWNSAQVGGQPGVSESGIAPAVSAAVSAGPRLGPGSPFLEVRLTWIGDPKLSTLSGSSTTVLFLLGYRFDVQ